MAEEWGNNLILYLYEADGSPIGMQYRNTSYAEDVFDTYWSEKNLQGNIVAVYNQAGTKLIAYTYDAWGNASITYSNGGASTTATYNPFRYRGYYFDSESGFYYLNSRYYDPAIGRFITADKLATVKASEYSLSDKNLYAYCDNNPVMHIDNGGMFWDTVFDIVSVCISATEVLANPANPWAWIGFAGDIVDIIPFVSGVGETAKIVGATIEVVNKTDGVVDTITVLKATEFTDEALDTINSLKKVEVDDIVKKVYPDKFDGTKIHAGYRADMKVPKIKKPKEYTYDAKNRFDFFDGQTIFELKSMNPQGLRDGISQLRRYNRVTEGKFNLVLELYG